MAVVVPDILARIVKNKRVELRETSQQRAELERSAAERVDVRNFRAALTASEPAIIAEIKKASPSKGVLLDAFQTIILPRRNERDLEDIQPEVRKELEMIFVDTVDEVIRHALRDGSGDAVADAVLL